MVVGGLLQTLSLFLTPRVIAYQSWFISGAAKSGLEERCASWFAVQGDVEEEGHAFHWRFVVPCHTLKT